ncbi:dihydroorotase [Gallaecimonas sp. GXIMD4217]|uniref:dihydroorotase n=1 Tax=Gallaecimonas sp. GXIMD4217 TaxID=3131927 RepID=UPI00311B2304
MSRTLIKNALLINEGKRFESDLLIKDGRIDTIARDISAEGATVVDAAGRYLMPGMIDDQVHFREPGLTHKGNIASESQAAAAGGVTSFMEMPNVNPQTTTLEVLEAKYELARGRSAANYSFYMGSTNDNLDEIRRLPANDVCGVKIFMGASTGNMLVDDEQVLEQIFADCPTLIATHCEDTPMIQALEDQARARYGEDVPMVEHARIRSREACYKSSSMAVGLAKRFGSRLHVLHITTKDELALFEAAPTLADLAKKQITAEACVHHLFFNAGDYERLGAQIKCNPSVKEAEDQAALLQAVKDGVIDIIATDHAPHTWEEKQNPYFKAPSGVPLVQHAVQTTLELVKQGHFSLELAVQKLSHAVAERYQLEGRGYLREGYFADLVLVDPNQPQLITKDNIRYHCNWSPFDGFNFSHSIAGTWVNGQHVFDGAELLRVDAGQRLRFNRR